MILKDCLQFVLLFVVYTPDIAVAPLIQENFVQLMPSAPLDGQENGISEPPQVDQQQTLDVQQDGEVSNSKVSSDEVEYAPGTSSRFPALDSFLSEQFEQPLPPTDSENQQSADGKKT